MLTSLRHTSTCLLCDKKRYWWSNSYSQESLVLEAKWSIWSKRHVVSGLCAVKWQSNSSEQGDNPLKSTVQVWGSHLTLITHSLEYESILKSYDRNTRVMLCLCLELARWATRLSACYSFIRPKSLPTSLPPLSTHLLVSSSNLTYSSQIPPQLLGVKALAQTTLPWLFLYISVSFHYAHLSRPIKYTLPIQKKTKLKGCENKSTNWLQSRSTKKTWEGY